MAFHRYLHIEPRRPDPAPVHAQFAASVALAALAATVVAPTDNLKLADLIGTEEGAISDAVGSLIDAETPAEEAPALGEIKKHALTVLALVAAYEARS